MEPEKKNNGAMEAVMWIVCSAGIGAFLASAIPAVQGKSALLLKYGIWGGVIGLVVGIYFAYTHRNV